MTSEEKLRAYETMRRNIQSEYEAVLVQMETLKAAGKEKSVTFRSLFGKKLLYKEIHAIYAAYGLKD